MRCLLLAMVLFTGSVAARDPQPLIDAVESRVSAGQAADAQIDALLAGLAATRNEDEVRDYLDAIEELGGADTASPQSVKQAFRAKSPPVLRKLFGTSLGWSV